MSEGSYVGLPGIETVEEGVITSRPKERRIPRTSHQVMDKMQRIADEHYGGALRDNVLEVFDRLHPIDRQTFLKKCLILYWEDDIDHATDELKDIKVDKETSIDMGVVKYERKDLREIDVEEQIKLKTWLNKAFLVLGCLAAIAVVSVTSIVGFVDGKNASGVFNNVLAIFGLFKG